MSVLFRNSQKGVEVLPGSVAALADFVLEREGSPEKEVSVLFVDDSEITELNRRHLGRNEPTDVLAFPMSREGEVDPVARASRPWNTRILGDVVVSAERAVSYAREHSLDPGQELSLYLIHGILHLLGYDDVDLAEARRMRRREKELLDEASKRELLVRIA